MSEMDWVIAVGATPLVLSLSFNLICDGLVKLVRFDLMEALVKGIPEIINKIETQNTSSAIKEKINEHV